MSVIYVKPNEVWGAYMHMLSSKHDDGDQFILIAENEGGGIEIYAGPDPKTDGAVPCIVVERDGRDDFLESCLSSDDCADTVRYVYEVYLTEDSCGFEDDDEPEFDEDDAIEDRERELDAAFEDLLTAVVDNQRDLMMRYEEIVEDLKDLVCERLARKYHLGVYRPMILVDEDGEEFYEEYPYEVMIYDDEQDEPAKKGA